MSALFYIIGKSIKNSLKELLKKPGKLFLYIFVIALIAAMIILSFFTSSYIDTLSPMFWFSAILFLFITLFFGISISKGLSGGDAIFEMNDVNLLFVSPVSSRKILLYGIVRMAKTAFWAGFFILFQSNSLANFGVGFDGVLLTFAGFLFCVIVLTILSLLIYSITNGKTLRKRIVKIFAVAVFIPLAVYLIVQYLNTQDVLLALESAFTSPFFKFVPIAGWTSCAITSILSGDILNGIFFFGLNFVLGAGLTIYILLSKADYYEDVLVATETAYEKKRALMEGNINAAASAKKVKVLKTGIAGTGAMSIFAKHMRESFRENRFGFLNLMSVFFIIGSAVAAFLVRDLITILQMLMWIQVFLIGTGRGLKETYSHYIYMIPESSFKKIICSNMELMLKTLIEGVLIFLPGGIILQAHPLFIIICILIYTLFSFLLLGVNYLFMRSTGANVSMGILMMVYFIAVLLIMAPGIILAVVAGSMIGGDSGLFSGLLILALWELIAGIICFIISRGVLHNCDMAVIKLNK